MPQADISALTLTPLDITLRLLCAMLIGMVVGIERELTHRPAGMRTHMLVALGSASVMMTSQAIFAKYLPYGATPDPARLSAQVITGVGFLGAGTILREGPSIKGLTTAASVWAVACLGIAAGGGFYVIAIAGLVAAMLILTVLEFVRRRFIADRNEAYQFQLECTDVVAMVNYITKVVEENDAVLVTVSAEEPETGVYKVLFTVNFAGRHCQERLHKFYDDLSLNCDAASITSEKCII